MPQEHPALLPSFCISYYEVWMDSSYTTNLSRNTGTSDSYPITLNRDGTHHLDDSHIYFSVSPIISLIPCMTIWGVGWISAGRKLIGVIYFSISISKHIHVSPPCIKTDFLPHVGFLLTHL